MRSASCRWASQAKLLQLLQSRQYYPLGGTQAMRANVRIISATNSNLRDMVAERRFREDLFFRLNVVPIEMPSLDQRIEDIPILVKYFCQQACRELAFSELTVSRRALAACQEESWPGNVRQLANAVKAAVIRAQASPTKTLDIEHLFPNAERNGDPVEKPRNFQDAMRDFQRRFLQEALEHNDWNVTVTARELGIARSHLYNLINAHDLKRQKRG